MISPTTFRAIVSGERDDVVAMLARGALWIAEGPYSLAMQARNWLFDRGSFEVRRVAVPVVSVGNLTLGGTGKTPLVAWIARWFRQREVRVAIVSRGYGAEQGSANDEFRELEQRLPDVPHLQDADRHAAATVAVEELDSQVILLDDAFQHRQLARDLDIVLLDASSPFGHDHVFPRGLLREPVAGLARADVVVLTRADMLDAAGRNAVREQVAALAPHAAWVEATHAPTRWIDARGEEAPLTRLAGQSVAAFCGLGNPDGFRHSLRAAGCNLVDFREFPDHHAYTRDDVDRLSTWAAGLSAEEAPHAEAIVCTHKDLVKLDAPRLGPLPLWALAIECEFLSGREELECRLERLLPRSNANSLE